MNFYIPGLTLALYMGSGMHQAFNSSTNLISTLRENRRVFKAASARALRMAAALGLEPPAALCRAHLRDSPELP